MKVKWLSCKGLILDLFFFVIHSIKKSYLLDDDKLVVSDTGVGISQEKLDSMFECFTRDQGNESHGFGVGLSIVQRLCDRFSWEIELESQKGL